MLFFRFENKRLNVCALEFSLMSILPQLISTAVVRVYCIGFLFDFLIASNHVNTQELYNDVKKGKFKTTQHIKY